MTSGSLPPSLGRRAENAALVSGALVAVTHVVACAGGPQWPRLVALGAFALCAVAAALGQGARWLDRWRLPLVLLLLTQVPQIVPTLNRPDGFEYYVIARSLIFDHDLQLGNDYQLLQSFGQFQDGKPVSRTPCGLAILWTPAIILVHLGMLVARALGVTVPADGASLPYIAGVTFASFLFGALALFLTEGLVRRRHGPALGLLVAFGVWTATPLAYYSVFLPAASHAASAMMVALFISLWLRHRESTHLRDWLLIGACGGLMGIVRIQDNVLLAIPVVDQVLLRAPGFFRRMATLLVGPAIAFVVQASVWVPLFGLSFLSRVSDRNYFLAEFHVMEVLLSPRHGLFVWTPLWLLGFLGWWIVLRRDLRLGVSIFAGFALLLVVNSGFMDWYGSIAFGQRRFLGLTLLFGLGLGQLFEVLRERPLVSLSAIVCALGLWNQQYTTIFNGRMVAKRSEPHTFDRLAPAQVDVFYRGWLEGEGRLPGWLFVAGYDNLKGIWLDEGRSLEGRIDLTVDDKDQPLSFLVGEGWLAAREKDGVAFRRSRGFYSTVRVPVYTPGSFRLVVKGRSVLPGREVRVRLGVNGVPVGEESARPEWGELRYDIPATAVRSGFNTLIFEYDPTQRSLDPGHEGLNSAVAFQDLRFERRSP